jgi:tRNA(Ile)-lysidine synthase
MRFVRGSGLSGLAGMPAERTLEGGITLLRPLLEVPRRLLYDYLSARRLDYVDDPSNAELGFDRNKVRHVLIPAILNTFPDAEGAIVRAAGRNRDAANFLTQAAGAAITWKPSFVGGDREGFEAPADEFWSAAPALRVESLLRKMNEIGEGRRAPGRLLDAVRRAPDAGGIVFEGAGWTLSQQAGRVCLVRAIVPPEECGYLFGVSLDAHETVVSLPFRLVSERRLCLPTAVVEDGLVVRSRRPGDTVRVRGRTKTLKRLLQEIGIHPRLRARVPILEDRLGVLGVYASVLGSQDVHADRLADANNSDSESSGTIEILLRTAIG